MGMGIRRWHFDEVTVKTKITRAFLLRILRYFLPYWRRMLVVVLALSASSVLGLIPQMVIKNIVDRALPGKDLGLLAILIGISFGATIIGSLIGVLENYLSIWISTHIVCDIRTQLFAYLEGMALQFFCLVKPGEIITRINSDVGGIQGVFQDTLVNLLQNLLILATTAAALFYLNWRLALIGMIIIPTFIFPSRKVGKIRWRIAARTQARMADLNQQIQEVLSISGATLMKIFTREREELRRFQATNEEVAKLSVQETLVGRWFQAIIRIFNTMGPLLIYFYGGYLFIKGEISVGAIIAFVALLQRLYGPVAQLSNLHIDVTRSFALFERIFEYLDQKQEITDAPGARPLEAIRGRVEFDHVYFGYAGNEEVLRDINFTVEPGTTVALVGPSGAGKTTIANLLPRLYDVVRGSVRIDGIDVRGVTQESLRSQIGLVMQETYIFNDTIRENLLYAKRDAGDAEIEAACRAAQIHEFIAGLHLGYETIVGNRGLRLSGGERQRIAIARVILKNPRIVILDEATSALDSISETYIQEALGPLLAGRTSFVIAHRLSTILAAHLILLVDRGEIVGAGRHEELLRSSDLYRTLCEKQFNTGGL